ncbi:response regulator, partial [bacterium]|nr:response regulator [bacterium]
MNSRILIADNDREIRESLASILTENDFICIKVSDGDEAIRKIKEDNFDILIVDIKLPKWDGIQVLDKVIKISPKTMTMMITASATVETAIEAL